jgi:hypothetical protein
MQAVSVTHNLTRIPEKAFHFGTVQLYFLVETSMRLLYPVVMIPTILVLHITQNVQVGILIVAMKPHGAYVAAVWAWSVMYISAVLIRVSTETVVTVFVSAPMK